MRSHPDATQSRFGLHIVPTSSKTLSMAWLGLPSSSSHSQRNSPQSRMSALVTAKTQNAKQSNSQKTQHDTQETLLVFMGFAEVPLPLPISFCFRSQQSQGYLNGCTKLYDLQHQGYPQFSAITQEDLHFVKISP